MFRIESPTHQPLFTYSHVSLYLPFGHLCHSSPAFSHLPTSANTAIPRVNTNYHPRLPCSSSVASFQDYITTRFSNRCSLSLFLLVACFDPEHRNSTSLVTVAELLTDCTVSQPRRLHMSDHSRRHYAISICVASFRLVRVM
jgi:hypothetical protein